MAKLDIKSAFRLCPVRPEDWHLLGFSFCDLYFVDLCLPFGLRSSVNRFTRLADTLIWILKNNYGLKNIIYDLDDFFLSASDFADCAQNIQLVCRAFNKLGIPFAPEKLVGSATSLTYLAIELDTELPPMAKLDAIASRQTC